MNKRVPGIDLIKVIMMLWIIMYHMANHSMVDLLSVPISGSWALESLCKMGGGYSRLYICPDYRNIIL